MKNILITTFEGDPHAKIVRDAINSTSGVAKCHLWYPSSFCEGHGAALHIDNVDSKIIMEQAEIKLCDIDLVWHRRMIPVDIPNDVDEEDHDFIRDNNAFLMQSTYQLLSEFSPLWINDYKSSRSINDKLKQLRLAKLNGFLTPETIITNNHASAINFVVEREECIVKYYFGKAWKLPDGGLKHPYTKTLTFDDLNGINCQDFDLSPVIIQEKIKAKYEVRVFYVAGHIVSCRIDTNESLGFSDWRMGFNQVSGVGIEKLNLPEVVKAKIKAFMKAAGILTGSLDFIVRPDGQYVFLEVNEMGNFLWMEHIEPNLRVLDLFASYLLDCDKQGNWKYRSRGLKMADFN